jgi:hypothetical protein
MTVRFVCNRCSKERQGVSRCSRCQSPEFRIVKDVQHGKEGSNQEGRQEGGSQEGR